MFDLSDYTYDHAYARCPYTYGCTGCLIDDRGRLDYKTFLVVTEGPPRRSAIPHGYAYWANLMEDEIIAFGSDESWCSYRRLIGAFAY